MFTGWWSITARGRLVGFVSQHHRKMISLKTATFTLAFALLGGCSTTQHITLAKAAPALKVTTVAQVPAEGNSPEMNANLTNALQAEGLQVKAPLPADARKSDDVDAIVSYVDVWRWDLVMYLKKLSVKMYDAKTGDLLVMGDWEDSPMHGFRDAKTAVNSVVSEMVAKLRAATK